MIELLALGIAATGILLLVILFTRIRAFGAELKLKRHRSRDAALADLLNYAAVVDDGVVICKNGALMAAWLYEGESQDDSTDEMRERASAMLNRALASLGDGWMLHVDAVRRPAPSYPPRGLSHFPDRVSVAMDEERRYLFEQLGILFEGSFVLSVTYFPPALAEQKLVEMMFDDDQQRPDSKSRTRDLLETFQRRCNELQSRLSSVLELQRLGSVRKEAEDGRPFTHDTLLQWLQFCIAGVNHPVRLPENPSYLDALLGGQELWGGIVPRVGNRFIQVVAIEGLPFESYPGMLGALAEIPVEYRWSNRFIFLDRHTAIKHLEDYRKKWKQKIRGFFDQFFNTHSGPVDLDALAMVEDAEMALAETRGGLVAQGYFTSVVVLMATSRETLEASSQHLAKTINDLGFTARVETINTMDAYLGSLPGHGVQNVRRPIVNTQNLADLLPTSSIWTGESHAPCPMYPPNSPALMHCVTTGHSPFRLNLHVRDLGHTIMFGPTRSGKSTHLGMIVSQFRRYPGARVFAFDKGMSMYPVCRATGGEHYTVGADDEALAFCPLQFLASRSDRAWAASWIEAILELNGVRLTPLQRNEVAAAIQNMHESGSRTLSDFSVTLQDEAVRQALKQYTVEGLMGHLLDAQEDSLQLSNFLVFELEELMGLGEKYALPILLYLFRRIEVSLDGKPTLIVLDEAWIMLGHTVFREKIREWLKTLAKKNCAVLMATQSLTDAGNSGILDVIVESTATKIFLPNAYARNEDVAGLYISMGLNRQQIEIIASSTPKEHYYYVSERGCRLYSLALGPFALAFVGATDKDSIERIRALERRHGPAWIDHWLHERDLDMADYEAER
nr:VirB4 family type IV secretion/conjugal transfer ATPase [uncultured Ralstonia sp.]